ncbi:hypothetical protein [Variibacter gotjawalensis]|uniref:hypothetical protein n=1 Tax=Variibacter gotjawalensis TaxID=1333996 RepID=UPI001DC24A8A|nr:hypothetical protein [Variibacter gotjawalensis]NIK46442.1 acyl-[acyl carrier protein]--UDP-N-acetylglucosamine O-acyltransferase [Variibacter gotjawalensis]
MTFNGALLDRAYPTTIGNDGIFKKGAHVAHDCVVGDGVVFEIGAAIAGHCRISNGVHIGTLSAVQQFTRIGTFAKIEDGCAVTSDVIPFGVASSSEVHVRFNADGARQSGLCDADVALVEELFGRLIGGDRALHRYARHRHILAARQIIAFIEAKNPNVIPAAPR